MEYNLVLFKEFGELRPRSESGQQFCPFSLEDQHHIGGVASNDLARIYDVLKLKSRAGPTRECGLTSMRLDVIDKRVARKGIRHHALHGDSVLKRMLESLSKL